MQSVFKKYFSLNSIIFKLIVFLILVLNVIAIANEFYFVALLPVIFFIAVLFFIKFEYVLYLIAFCIPLSVTLADNSIKLGLSLPTEPLMIIATSLFWFNAFINKKIPEEYNKIVFAKILFAILIWTFITSLTSTEFLVSIKFLLAKCWFFTSAFFIPILYFKNILIAKRMFKAICLGMGIVSLYTIIGHALENFSEPAAHWIMSPFFADHTSYGALLALLIPVSIYFAFDMKDTISVRLLFKVVALIIICGVMFSYTRAAWVSLAAIVVFYFLFLLRLKLKRFLFLTSIVILVIGVNLSSLLDKIEKNNQDSSSNISEHAASISNISTDASNLERLNRWYCAIEMFEQKPFLGWGPNSYQFKYATFQKKEFKTIISTNGGDGGNAHSEYLGVLCEQGFTGLILWIIAIAAIIFYGYKNFYNKNIDNNTRNYSLAIFLGIATYLLHGFLNNFLDQDKLAFPFWCGVAVISAIDLYSIKEVKD